MKGATILLFLFIITLNFDFSTAFWKSRDDIYGEEAEHFYDDENGELVDIRDEYSNGLDFSSMMFKFFDSIILEQFPILDSDGDGVLNSSEITLLTSELLPFVNATMTNIEFMDCFDINRDGFLTLYEATAFSRRILEDALSGKGPNLQNMLGMIM